jgi:hypothetical protein
MSPVVVIVILNGAIVASAPPAQLLFGHVMAPLAPVITRFSERAEIAGNTITVTRQGRTCILHVGSDAFACDGVERELPVAPFGRDGVAFVPLAELARALGGAAAYDSRTHIVALDLPPARALQTPPPFDPSAPRAAPTVIFTPTPAPATPRPLDSTSPQPRRTAIPAIPSRVPEN